MMKINHEPTVHIQNIEKRYSEADGVPVTYVCTTELPKYDNILVNVFYRETPHPQFGNRYFGILIHPVTNQTMICNADDIETVEFGMVENDNGELEYSRFRHDYKKFENGNMIDGGRAYVRSSGTVKMYQVRNGAFEET